MTDRKPKVFLMEQLKSHMDLSTALPFGELVYIFEPRDRRTSIFDSDNFVCEVIDVMKAKEFDPCVDYFCMAGGQINLVLAAFALQAVCDINGIAQIRMLVFNSVSCGYEEMKILMSDSLLQFKAKRDTGRADTKGRGNTYETKHISSS